jgi:hypothetical protein
MEGVLALMILIWGMSVKDEKNAPIHVTGEI